MCWSNECTFEIGLDTTPPYVRRPRGKAYESRYLKPTFKSGRETIGVWGVISLGKKGSLQIIKKGGRINAKRYVRILHDAAIPFYQEIYERHGIALWQQDGAKYHTAKMTMAYLEAHGVLVMKWPA